MGRALAIDFGEKRIGIAISDELKIIARPIPTICVTSQKKVLREICDITRREDVDTIVIGIPFYPSGDESRITEKVKGFLGSLKDALPEISFLERDERYSSVEAERILREKRENTIRKPGRIDQVSALIILQGYLDERNA